MHTRDYCKAQLLLTLREPTEQYFEFLFECANADAVKDQRKGKLKELVKFQQRVKRIQKYDDKKMKKVLHAFKKNNTPFPVATLVKTILMSNAMIIGSFGGTTQSHNIKIPSEIDFLREFLTNVGLTYYNDPLAALGLGGRRKNFDVIKDGLERTLYKVLPFEDLMSDVKQTSDFGGDIDHSTKHMMRSVSKMNDDELKLNIEKASGRFVQDSDGSDNNSGGDNSDNSSDEYGFE